MFEFLHLGDKEDIKRVPPTAAYIARIEVAMAMMSSAYSAHGLAAPNVDRARNTVAGNPVAKRDASWFDNIMETTLEHLALLTITFRESLETVRSAQRQAFDILIPLTPFEDHLRLLAKKDALLAYQQLALHLEAFEVQLLNRLSASPFLEPLSLGVLRGEQSDSDFESFCSELIERAGGALTLSQAASRLGYSKQNLHKHIHANTALGMMRRGRIIVPTLQMSDSGKKFRILPGIDKVIKAFAEAKVSGWGALQFLIDPDPNLEGRTPIEVLREDRVDEVEIAARAYLGLDEG